MIGASFRTVLKGQAEETGRIEPVNRRPTVKTIADLSRFSFLARSRDEHQREALIVRTMHGRREAYG
jgi:hypothetical protein